MLVFVVTNAIVYDIMYHIILSNTCLVRHIGNIIAFMFGGISFENSSKKI